MPNYDKEQLARMIQAYNQQMMSQYAAKLPSADTATATENTTPVLQEDTADPYPNPTSSSTDEQTDIGYLQIRVSTENQAVPIEGAVVTITHTRDNDRYIDRSLLTDNSGLTTITALPTKDRALSLTPGAVEPFSVYTVEVSADGYFPKIFTDLPIYGGVTAIQSVSMIPLPEAGGDDIVLTYPQSGPSL